jgi:hypothetical protein
MECSRYFQESGARWKELLYGTVDAAWHCGLQLRRKAKDRAEDLRTDFEELSSLSANKAAEELNIRGVPTPFRGTWHATQVIRVRQRLAQ